MKVCLTGATGLVGSAVAHELHSRGILVRAYVRPTSNTSRLPDQVEVARGELSDRLALKAALIGMDGLVHVAGIATLGTHDEATLRSVNAGAVGDVLEGAREAGVRRVLVTSSTSVMGGTSTPELMDESTQGNAEALGISYFVSKLLGERVALRAASRGQEVVVVRPSYVLGPGDVHGSSASTVVALARRRIPGYVAGGASFCDVRDVAAGHVEALLRGQSGEVYVLGGHNLSMDEFVKEVCAAAGVRAPPRVPYLFAWANAFAAEAFARMTKRRPRITRDLVRAASLFTFVSSAKAVRDLSYRIRPFEEMVRDTLLDAVARGRLEATTPELKAL